MRYKAFDKSLFVRNRARFTAALPPNSIAIFHSADEMPRSADQNFDFRQNPDLFFLSGIDQEQSILILYPDAPEPKYREILFLRKTSEHIKVWEGHKYSKQEAKATSGLEFVHWIEDFDGIFAMLMNRTEYLFLNSNEHGRSSNKAPYKDLRFAQEMRERYPLHQLRRSAQIMHGLRAIKQEEEVAAIREACNITGRAFERVCEFVKPGVMEYEIEAEIIHEFIRSGSAGHAYAPIVASGENACILHYGDNNQVCNKGDLLLMDFGAEYGNYRADLSRTIPVSGKFTDRQADVYNAVLRVMKEATSMLTPGTNLFEYHKEVGLIMQAELVALGLLKQADIDKHDPDKLPLYKKYFMHGTSHHLGLDVHDVGDTYKDIKAGMVFTVEPGIYIPDEQIGIRIENDVLVTDTSPLDLMGHIPREVEELEELMNATVRG